MSSYEHALRSPRWQLQSLPWRRLWQDKKLRFALFALLSSIVGYALVLFLTQKGVGKWRANESVSKSMAPIGLALNTLALTGKLRPTRGQAVKWVLWWLPSAIASAFWMKYVSGSDLNGLECRAVAGATMFPIDYLVKRFIVYSKVGATLKSALIGTGIGRAGAVKPLPARASNFY